MLPDKKRVYILIGMILAVTLLAEILLAHPHHHRIWNVMPGADILLGFTGAWILILLGKGVMNRLLRRSEEYYTSDGSEDREDMK